LLKVLQRSESAFAKGNWVEIAKLWPEMDAVQAQYNADAALGSTRDHADWDLAVDKGSSAIEALERARIRDPLDPAVLVYLAEAYANTGRIKDALAEQDRGLALVPSGLLAVNSVITAYATNDAALIEKNWKRALSVSSDAAPIDRIRSNRAATLAELRRQAAARPQVVPSSRIALWAAIFGDPKLALQALREDQDPGRRRITAMALWRPVMTDVRQLSEFKDLVREWGLVDYWREFGWGDHCKPVGDNDFECR
jgi:tetratricopeptide (TPR) repeat protein